MTNDFITVTAAAQYAGVTPETIRNLCKAHTIRYQKRGTLFFPCLKDIEQYANTIAAVYRIEVDIAAYKAELQQELENYRQAVKDLRERMYDIQMFPRRIEAIKEMLVSTILHYDKEADKALTDREVCVMLMMLKGKSFDEAGHDLALTTERIRQIWYKALRKYAATRNALQAKDDEIARLQGVIDALKDRIDLLENGTDSDNAKNKEFMHMVRLLQTNIRDCNFSVRVFNALKNEEVHTLLDLVQVRRSDLMRYRNFGNRSMREIDEYLADKGLALGMDVYDYVQFIKHNKQQQHGRTKNGNYD